MKKSGREDGFRVDFEGGVGKTRASYFGRFRREFYGMGSEVDVGNKVLGILIRDYCKTRT